jgi:hypothetical protein
MYRQIYGMSQLPAFKGFEDYFVKKIDLFKRIYDSSDPHEEALPEHWNDKLDEF